MKYRLDCPIKTLRGKICLPTSKSISNRLLIIQALTSNEFDIAGLSDSDDTHVLQEGLRSASELVDVGHAGTSMRFLTAYFAATGQAKTITGSGRMKNRPISDLVDALNQLGAGITYIEKEGCPPVRTSGNPLSGNTISINGNISSQFITALLLIAPTLPEGLTINITGRLVSASYVGMTLELMRQAGVETVRKDNTITVTGQYNRSDTITVECDWSAASYWYEMASLFDEVELLLEGATAESLQGDAVASQIARAWGISTEYIPEGALLTRHKKTCHLLEFDFINAPDIIQTLAVTSCLNNTPFRFTGTETLRVKETDRIAALQNELLKLGFVVKEPEKGVLEWDGERTNTQSDICISTYQDHRMAMSFAPVAVAFPDVLIDAPEVVSKSYPGFWKDLKNIGFNVRPA